MVWLITYGALLIDLLFILYLANRRTRVFGFIFVLAFHFINSRLFDIGIFPWLMIAATLIFFPPGWPRRMLWDIRRAHPVRVPALGLGFVLGAFIGGTLPADFSWVHIIIGGLGTAVAAYHLEEPFRRLEVEPPTDTRSTRRRGRNRRASLNPVPLPVASAPPGKSGPLTPQST